MLLYYGTNKNIFFQVASGITQSSLLFYACSSFLGYNIKCEQQHNSLNSTKIVTWAHLTGGFPAYTGYVQFWNVPTPLVFRGVRVFVRVHVRAWAHMPQTCMCASEAPSCTGSPFHFVPQLLSPFKCYWFSLLKPCILLISLFLHFTINSLSVSPFLKAYPPSSLI